MSQGQSESWARGIENCRIPPPAEAGGIVILAWAAGGGVLTPPARGRGPAAWPPELPTGHTGNPWARHFSCQSGVSLGQLTWQHSGHTSEEPSAQVFILSLSVVWCQ